jgi:peptide/nickel transport system ATP-binding protein
LVGGESEAARVLLADEFETISERDPPDLRETAAGHPAACHLHDQDVKAYPVPSRTREE